jgi:8-hydroxy-5-deazaflavin:NADPH oxidoreductase
MKIGVIGSGNMGRALGVRLANLGHSVMFGARRPGQVASAAALAGSGGKSGSTDDAARFGEVLVWTMREPNPAAVLTDPSLLDGKIVIDLNNRHYAEARSGALPAQAIAAQLQAKAAKARVVKAFNTIAMEAFDTSPAALRAGGAQTFIAGDDPEAKAAVVKLSDELGFEAVDVGGIEQAFVVEALGDVVRLVMIEGGRGFLAHLRIAALPNPDLQTIGSRDPSPYG